MRTSFLSIEVLFVISIVGAKLLFLYFQNLHKYLSLSIDGLIRMKYRESMEKHEKKNQNLEIVKLINNIFAPC